MTSVNRQCMQYDCLEELMMELSLYPTKALDIIKRCAMPYGSYWFVVFKDGNCALFDEDGQLDDVNKVKYVTERMIPAYIKKIILPDSVVKIYPWAFANYTELEDIQLGKSLATVGEHAFANCGIKKIEFPESTTNIHHSVFQICEKLEEVIFNGKIKNIAYHAFYECPRLMSIKFMKNTIEEVEALIGYPFGLDDISIIQCEK